VTSLSGSKQAWVTLQRPPPEMITFPSVWLARSRINTFNCGFNSAQRMAAKNPAGPPPVMTTSQCDGMDGDDILSL
jgi:hypothetical protein